MQAAPLLGIAQAPVPDGGKAFWLDGEDGVRTRIALFAATGVPRGTVVLSPGRAEPIEKYFEVIEELRGRGFAVLAHDWRGQGLSARLLPDRLKGHAHGFEGQLSDFSLMLDRLAGELPKPWICLAHSMGAGLVLLALARGESRFAAAAMTAPMIGLYSVRNWPAGLAPLVAGAAARLGFAGVFVGASVFDPFNQPFAGNILTHDRARFERFAAQLKAHRDLAIGGVTWGWIDYALRAGAVLSRPTSAAALRLPLTIVAAGDDRLVLNPPIRRLAQAAPQARYVEIPEAYHEILMETDPVRAVFWREFEGLTTRVERPS